MALLAVILTSARLVLPEIDRFRDSIGSSMSASLGMPVELGALSSRLRTFHPSLVIEYMTLYSDETRSSPVLNLRNVTAEIDLFASLWQWQPVLKK